MVGKKQKKFIASVLKMLYYKKLDLDFDLVSKKTLDYVISNRDKITSFWNHLNLENFIKNVPEITRMFAPLNITPAYISLIVATQDAGIHRDTYIKVTPTPVARINIPILNCQGSETRFWSTSAEPELLFLDNGTPYRYLDEKDCKLETILELDRPTVLRVKEPHSVVVGKKVPRISLTIEFEEDIEYLLNN
jgi:hypothetical protein